MQILSLKRPAAWVFTLNPGGYVGATHLESDVRRLESQGLRLVRPCFGVSVDRPRTEGIAALVLRCTDRFRHPALLLTASAPLVEPLAAAAFHVPGLGRTEVTRFVGEWPFRLMVMEHVTGSEAMPIIAMDLVASGWTLSRLDVSPFRDIVQEAT